MSDLMDLIKEEGPMYGGTALSVDLRGGKADVQPSIDGGWQVYLALTSEHGFTDERLTNQQAIALGLALIRCAKEVREI